ncbi:MAG: hypothetical protein JNL79_21330 [Myxococcales bacterium]|nr:hypothetical protein [Myxococcales bacterium]
MSVDGIPEARDDDPEDVADKLGIAQAMWARGERGDALSWLRRAAEAASDADVDMRALELAKAASALAPLVAMQTAPPQPGNAAVRPAAVKPAAVKPAAPAAAPVKAQTQPPKAAIPMAKLGALPPLRPLGQAPPNAPAKGTASRPATLPSTPAAIVAATNQFPPKKPEAKAPPPPSSRPPAEERATIEPVTADFDDHDDEATHQIQLSPARPESDFESTATHQVVDMAYLRGVSKVEPVVEPAAAEPEPSVPISIATSEPPRTTLEPSPLPLAVGIRVRIKAENGQLIVTPDRDPTGPSTNDAGTAAILSPAHPDDDLRTLFYLVR